ncbi:prevent-host-death protein [Chryseobacterium lactis]|uniref:Prevent-host-death protein n=1 Tax=Chryseobacterium lactis TaxID=1241981 RepID=A0A3G6RS31_CHRLC|nr:prevent-host-death protein [Chryseobacterium lactis]AZA84248.1 prevent-host-death protein [Chryseobacterium lactis]AZB04636.1 prevent-host-death protein [Chryseobacterium lactis]PNW14367.1 prevent-host-death protein [Chryseobacterium lactis]
MDTNRFKSSHDFSNIQKNLHNNPGYSVESYSQQVKDYINDMKSNNQEATKQGFMTQTQKSAKDVWDEIQEMASEAWEKNKHHSDEKK